MYQYVEYQRSAGRIEVELSDGVPVGCDRKCFDVKDLLASVWEDSYCAGRYMLLWRLSDPS